MKAMAFPMCAILLAAWFGGTVVLAADAPREAHGSSDAFAAPGVRLAWGVLRGANEASTIVVMRVVTDAQVYPWLSLTGMDPFTKAERTVQTATQSAGVLDVRMPRAQFADFPRTELRLFGSSSAAQGGEPALVVYYHGVPDTTPEFNDAARLDAHLATRIATLRGTGGKPP